MENKDYEPYGLEWAKELMKWNKKSLEEVFGVSGNAKNKKKQIEEIRIKLKNEDNNGNK